MRPFFTGSAKSLGILAVWASIFCAASTWTQGQLTIQGESVNAPGEATAIPALQSVGGLDLQLSIDVGSFTLPGETLATSAIQIQINNPGPAISVGGLDFRIEVAPAGPKIKSVDLLTGTIFQFNHTGPVSSGNTEYLQSYTLIQDISQAAPQLQSGLNLVASIIFDTTSVAPGTYSLKLANTSFGTTGDTVYNDPSGTALSMSIVNGSLTVVPESDQFATVIGLSLLGLAIRRRLCRRVVA